MSFNLYRRWLRVASIVLLVSCFAGAQSDGSHPGSIQFTNVTAAAGIKFTNYRGNEGIAINREIFGPGVCVADFDGDGLQDTITASAFAMPSTTTTGTEHLPTLRTRPASLALATEWVASGAITITPGFQAYM
jgi:hypothetical protein